METSGASAEILQNKAVQEKAIEFEATESLLAPSRIIAHLGFCLLAGLLFDYFFRTYIPGISVLVFAIFILSVAGWSFGERIHLGFNFQSFLILPILLLAGTFALFTNEALLSINTLLLPALFLLLFVVWAKGTTRQWSDLRIIGDIIAMLWRTPVNSVKPAAMIVKTAPLHPQIRQNAAKILLGFGLSIPMVFLLIVLLNSADAIFSSYINYFVSLFHLDVPTILAHGFMICIPALGLSGMLWTLRTRQPQEYTAEKAIERRRWNALIFATFLVSVNLLYAVFCWIQFSYLFAGAHGSLPQAFSYAEYARRGFFELAMITFANLMMAAGGIYSVRKGHGAANRFAQYMLTLLVVQSFIIVISAFTRLSLYEAFYGYTYTRIFARTMIILMGVVLVLLLVRTWKETFPFWKCFLIASLSIYIGLNYFNIDQFIANSNIERYRKLGKLDVQYLMLLSDEAVPSMLPLLDEKNDDTSSRILGNLGWRKQMLEKHKGIPEFNFSRHRAMKLLNAINTQKTE